MLRVQLVPEGAKLELLPRPCSARKQLLKRKPAPEKAELELLPCFRSTEHPHHSAGCLTF